MAEVYAGLAGLHVHVVDGYVCFDVSHPDSRKVQRYRLDADAAAEMGWGLLDLADQLRSGS